MSAIVGLAVVLLFVVVLFAIYWTHRDAIDSPEQHRAAIERREEMTRAEDAKWRQARVNERRAYLAEKYPTRPTSTARQEILEYLSKADFDSDRRQWINSGWRVASISDKPQPPGVGRVLGLGFIGALVWKPEAHVVVVYDRVAASAPGPVEQTPTQAFINPTDELERLAVLHERGALTDDEFDRAKRRVLGGDQAPPSSEARH